VRGREIRLYTHYEGLQVVHEMFCLHICKRALALRPRIVVDVGAT